MAHWYPNASIMDINTMGLKRFVRALNTIKHIENLKKPATSHREFVERQLAEQQDQQ